MKINSVFDVIGPVMVGPSSSHTAGAVRIGLATHQILGGTPIKLASFRTWCLKMLYANART